MRVSTRFMYRAFLFSLQNSHKTHWLRAIFWSNSDRIR